ncbi:MAG: hypothetical protein HKN80_13675, partial [Acidimicrobiia bacterium]|nr:hypothetical protein [Acidimicrobiia bacterium]
MRGFLTMLAVLLAGLLFAACRPSAGDTTIPAATTPSTADTVAAGPTGTTPPVAYTATRADIEAAIARIGPIERISQVRELITAIDAGTEPDLVPYLY